MTYTQSLAALALEVIEALTSFCLWVALQLANSALWLDRQTRSPNQSPNGLLLSACVDLKRADEALDLWEKGDRASWP